MYCGSTGCISTCGLEQDRLCCLVIVGVRLDGTKELVAIADGYRESTDSWADLLRDLQATRDAGPRGGRRRRGAGVLGRAARRVAPATATSATGSTRSPTSWTALPKVVQAGARKALAEIRDAPDRDSARRAVEALARDYGVKWPKAVAKVADDADESPHVLRPPVAPMSSGRR